MAAMMTDAATGTSTAPVDPQKQHNAEAEVASSSSTDSCDESESTTPRAADVVTDDMNTKHSSIPFHVTTLKQSHLQRQREILAKYPAIKDLYGPDIRLLPSMLAITVAQLCLSVYVSNNYLITNWIFWVLAYSLGGLFTHWLSLGNHELCHDLCFAWVEGNDILGTIANLAQGIPSFISFRKYHADHHWFLNEFNEKHIDPDVPTEWEARFFVGSFRKAIWVLLNPLFYSVRPLFVSPKQPSFKEFLNIVTVIGFDILLWNYVSHRALVFNLVSTALGMGLHPVAGHFMSEHYNLYSDEGRQETYSYYGIGNYVTFNVGYHNEHHDFPKISGFRLPLVKAMAPEYYDDKMHPHFSWIKIISDFILRDDIGLDRRIVRQMTETTTNAKNKTM